MARLNTLFFDQWADLPLRTFFQGAKSPGNGVPAANGSHHPAYFELTLVLRIPHKPGPKDQVIRRGRRHKISEKKLKLAFSYSHKDEALRDELETHLKPLQRKGIIQTWHDRKITPGEAWNNEADTQFAKADIILLLVSADYLASEYCYHGELKNALSRHAKGKVRVVPIIVRDVDWQNSPLGRLQVLPTDGKAVTLWPDRDTAWKNVVQGIQRIVKELQEESHRKQ